MADAASVSRYGMTPPKGTDDNLWDSILSDLSPSPMPSPIPVRGKAKDGGYTSVAAPAVPILSGGKPTGVDEWVPTEA